MKDGPLVSKGGLKAPETIDLRLHGVWNKGEAIWKLDASSFLVVGSHSMMAFF